MKLIILTISLFVAVFAGKIKKELNTQDAVKLTIAATNDIHGGALSEDKKYGDTEYSVGGFESLETMLNTLKEVNPNFIYLDAGDQYQGTYENEKTKGQIIFQALGEMGLKATTIGNHEWDWGKSRFDSFLKNGKYDYVCANLEKKSLEIIEQEKAIMEKNKKEEKKFENVYKQTIDDSKIAPYKIYEVPLNIGGTLKLGVIGLTTVETWTSTSYPPLDYKITDYLAAIKTQVAALKGKVDSIVVISHVGIKCEQNDDTLRMYKKYTPNDAQSEANCKQKELGKLLETNGNELLENGEPIIDAWIAGHQHDTAHLFYKKILPIVQNPLGGNYFNAIHLTFKKDKDGKFKIDRAATEIEGAIPICTHVFESTGRCESEPDKQDKMKPFIFNGKAVTKGSKVKDLFDKSDAIKEVLKMKKDILAETELDLNNEQTSENPIGNLFGALLQEHFAKENKNVIYIAGWGGQRTNFAKGFLSAYHLKKMFPFGGKLVEAKITGANLYKLVKQLQEGAKPFYITYGIKATVSRNTDGKVKLISTLEDMKLVDAKDNESKIDPANEYNIIISAFHSTGGDDFGGIDKLVNGGFTEVNIGGSNEYYDYFKTLLYEKYQKQTKKITNADVFKKRLIVTAGIKKNKLKNLMRTNN